MMVELAELPDGFTDWHGRTKVVPSWVAGDSTKPPAEPWPEADLVFTCPPYYDLERYGQAQADISNAPTYDEFLQAYRNALLNAYEALREDRFFVVVVGEIRDRDTGTYRGLVPDTIRICTQLGLHFYNELVLATAIGSLPVRAARYMASARKVGKAHQNVLVFVKGDAAVATEACGPVVTPTVEELLGAKLIEDVATEGAADG